MKRKTEKAPATRQKPVDLPHRTQTWQQKALSSGPEHHAGLEHYGPTYQVGRSAAYPEECAILQVSEGPLSLSDFLSSSLSLTFSLHLSLSLSLTFSLHLSLSLFIHLSLSFHLSFSEADPTTPLRLS